MAETVERSDLVLADTSVIIDFLRGRQPGAGWFREALAKRRVGTTAITAFELELGVSPGTRRQAELHRLLHHLPVFPLDTRAAILAAQVEHGLRREGRVIGPADVLVAGICLARKLPLVTADLNHFPRVPGLKILTPAEAR
jgi:predicted nucleic acid-binding protein